MHVLELANTTHIHSNPLNALSLFILSTLSDSAGASVTVTTRISLPILLPLSFPSRSPLNMRHFAQRLRSSEGCAPSLNLCCSRAITTGESYSYRPGRVAKGLRYIFSVVTPRGARRRLAVRMQAGMERAEALEREHMWVKKHGSPLQVMGLPDHAELSEVRGRYRSLVLETHPDSAPQAGRESEYAILKKAYGMATDPHSLWHRNGSSPVLCQQLLERSKVRVSRIDKVRSFAVMSYAVMILTGVFFTTVIVTNVLEAALQFFDPKFYQFMVAQEEEEERKLRAGEYVDKNPKRLAPTAVKKLLFPGRYIHGNGE